MRREGIRFTRQRFFILVLSAETLNVLNKKILVIPRLYLVQKLLTTLIHIALFFY